MKTTSVKSTSLSWGTLSSWCAKHSLFRHQFVNSRFLTLCCSAFSYVQSSETFGCSSSGKPQPTLPMPHRNHFILYYFTFCSHPSQAHLTKVYVHSPKSPFFPSSRFKPNHNIFKAAIKS